jgi:deoxyribonucleoside regulator
VASYFKRLDLQVQVATLYYKDKLSQQEIAKQLNMSRPTISRILQRCLDDGIVTIRILDIASHQHELAMQVRKMYNLQYVSVVSNQKTNDQTLSLIGTSVMNYLDEIIKRDTRIGISAGNTIEHIIPYLHPILNYNINIFQMIGDATHQLSTCSSFLTTSIAKALGGEAHAMHVPLLVHSKVLRDLLLEELPNKIHFQELCNLDIALFGLGNIEPSLSTMDPRIYDIPSEREILRSHNLVGDICANYLDINGRECQTEFSDRTIAISLDKLKNCPIRIAVACGKEKRDIALAALHGKYITSMIIDSGLAGSLLQR